MIKQEALQYPCIVSDSPSIFPNYLILPEDGSIVTIGRESDNDICIDASHISRLHAEIRFNSRRNLEIRDVSRNGVSCGGQRIPQGEVVEIQTGNQIRLDFKNDLVLEILFRAVEKQYSANAVRSDGSPSFSYNQGGATEVFFLNENEYVDGVDDSRSSGSNSSSGGSGSYGNSGSKLNLGTQSDGNTKGLYSLAGNKSSSYRNREQNSLSVFSAVENKVSFAKRGRSLGIGLSSIKGYNFSPLVIAVTAALSALAVILAVLIF